METLEEKVQHIEVSMAAHDSQCEERWKTTFNRLEDIESTLERIEGKIVTMAGAAIIFLGGLVVTMGMALLDKL